MALHVKVAETIADLDDAASVRWRVFVEELGYLERSAYPATREVDGFDTLATTRHLLAYDDERPVATVRMLHPNPGVALEAGGGTGLSLDRYLRFEGFGPEDRVIEMPRSCVLRSHRHSGVMLHLYGLAWRLGLASGVTHWVAIANMATDHPEDAAIIHRMAQAFGHDRAPQRAALTVPPAAPHEVRHPFFDETQRARGRAGAIEDLPYPKPLSLFAWMGIRFVGPPFYDKGCRVYAMPLVLRVTDLPSEIRLLGGGISASPAAAPPAAPPAAKPAIPTAA